MFYLFNILLLWGSFVSVFFCRFIWQRSMAVDFCKARTGRRGRMGRMEEKRKRGSPFFVRPPPFHSFHSHSSPRSRFTKVYSHAALPDKTAKENRSERVLQGTFQKENMITNNRLEICYHITSNKRLLHFSHMSYPYVCDDASNSERTSDANIYIFCANQYGLWFNNS